MKPIKILIATPEAIPFAKTGGLADVTGALPKVLKGLGCEVRLIMPFYRQIQEPGEKTDIKDTGIQVSVPLGFREIDVSVFEGSANGIPAYFLKRDEYYDRKYLYTMPDGDYFDNAERFILFSRGVIEAIKKLDFQPDIIHCHDWQTGLISTYLKTIYKDAQFFANTKTVFTIHNIAYQGQFPESHFSLTGLPQGAFTPDGIEFWGNMNLLKAGIIFSDIVTTVSEKYSKEIQTPEFGYGLEGVLMAKKDKLFGVLNGVDYDDWSPEKDKFTIANYDYKNLSGKAECRKDLLREYMLNLPDNAPVIGIISRLADQKGFDILSQAMEDLMSMNIGMVVLGTGEKKYHDLFAELAKKYPKKLGVKITFDNKLAHKIEAGSDMFLMPSKYEPCGLNQIYSLKYGTIPIVRATGGLDDTIQDYTPPPSHPLLKRGFSNEPTGNGFKFNEYSSHALLTKIKEAVKIFPNKKEWEKLAQTAMQQDFSWQRSAKRYVELYERLLTP
ncbi:MAG: glycogen synthase GlgA [Deltaproteobacteria bacterium]|nr:glycogen synthase GlgA [Deltaproteobacteria bacterium]